MGFYVCAIFCRAVFTPANSKGSGPKAFHTFDQDLCLWLRILASDQGLWLRILASDQDLWLRIFPDHFGKDPDQITNPGFLLGNSNKATDAFFST